MKKKVKKSTQKIQRVDIVVRTSGNDVLPTTMDLAEPLRNGKKMTIPQTWLSEQQLIHMVDKTPKQFVYKRKGKGGKEFDYVTGAYIQKVLNYCFGWNWDYEVVEQGREQDHIWVKGRLTVRGNKIGQQIVKTQFGHAEVKYLKGTKNMLDYGNDLKAAATDALKKCASLLGIASDIYGKMEYKDESGHEPQTEQSVGLAGQLNKTNVVEVLEKLEEKYKENNPILCAGATKKGCSTGEIVSIGASNLTKKLFGKALCKDCFKEVQAKK